MSASEALRLAEENGVCVRVSGNDLILEADQEPAAIVLEALKCHKAEVISMLAPGHDTWMAADWKAMFDERAAIAEFDGGQSREQAEALAFSCCIAEWLNQNPATSDPDSCAWCRQQDTGMHAIVPFNSNGIHYTWLHPECWGDWYAARKREAIAALQCAGLPAPAKPRLGK